MNLAQAVPAIFNGNQSSEATKTFLSTNWAKAYKPEPVVSPYAAYVIHQGESWRVSGGYQPTFFLPTRVANTIPGGQQYDIRWHASSQQVRLALDSGKFASQTRGWAFQVGGGVGLDKSISGWVSFGHFNAGH